DLGLVFQTLLDDSRSRPTLTTSSCSENRAVSAKQFLGPDRYGAFESDVDGPQFEENLARGIPFRLHQARQVGDKVVRRGINTVAKPWVRFNASGDSQRIHRY